MARKWTKEEEFQFRKELIDLYVTKNLSLKEISKILFIKQSSVFKRLNRLNIKTTPQKKKHYLNKRNDIIIPNRYSKELAEIIGILLGDGSLTHFQIVITLGNKEYSYAEHVKDLMNKIFNAKAKIGIRSTKYLDVYFGSTDVSLWLQKQGLVFNKVKEQVDVPKWVFTKKIYMKACLRGFFDTDGSVYSLKYGVQISLTNYSSLLLTSLRKMLFELQYTPSRQSSHKVYLTRKEDVQRFFKEIQPKNIKHQTRFKKYASVV